MSKKSRRRNRRLAKAAALIGGLALLGRRRQGTAQGVGGADKAAFTSDAAYKIPSKADTVVVPPKKNYINKKSDTGSNSQTRFTAKGDDGVWRGPGATIAYNKLRAGNKVPPSMRGGAETAQGFVRQVPIRTGTRRAGKTQQYGWSTQPYEKSWFGNPKLTPYRPMKKGGRVKLAKRGLGRAFTKAKKQHKEII